MARRLIEQPQRGAALLLFMIMMVMATLTYVVNSFSPEMIEAVRQKKGKNALAEAEDALIGYALTYRERQAMIDIAVTSNDEAMYGFLPMPDMGSVFNQHAALFPEYTGEGWATLNNTRITQNFTYIGRFPWKTVGTPPLRDGGGECLWYVVSAAHREPRATGESTAINWDSLGQLDLVNTNIAGTASAQGLSGHDRPIAVIVAPGGRLTSLNVGPTADDVSQCGGNYTPGNYLEFTTLGPAPFNTTTVVGGDTSAQSKPVATRGKIFADKTLIANDIGIPITADTLFSGIRNKSQYFRTDINALLERITSCLRDEFYSGSVPATNAKIAGADNNACYGSGAVPLGYYPSYREMLFVVPGAVTANGNSACAGALLFGSQRGSGQSRDTAALKADVTKYLEDINLISYVSGTTFSGPENFERVSTTQSASRDIVRCIPNTPSFAAVSSPNLTQIAQLASYNAATQTLSLGQTVTSAQSTNLVANGEANYLYGCSWRPETHAMGGGLRAYFKFRINDTGFSSAVHEGITFAIVDGDNNGTDACGEAAQHMGYSGNNGTTPFIVPPKIAFEVDPRASRDSNPSIANFFFDQTTSSSLTNGRNDPATGSTAYRGGHVAIHYWGGESYIATGTAAPCTAPRVNIGGNCYLPPEEDDNVHGHVAAANVPPYATSRTGYPAPPKNPAAPAVPLSVPPDTPQGVYKLDPSRSAVPTNQDIHVRLELERESASTTISMARVASTASLNLSAPGNSIDGVPLVAGDRVLAKDQALPEENGLYVWNGAAAAMTRTTDADSTVELAGLVVEVQQGTNNARSLWRQAVTNATLGTTALRWSNVRVKVAAPVTTNLSSPGATLDGIKMKVNDRVLVTNTGVYVWNGAALAMTAASDIVAGAAVQVQQGSEAGAWYYYDGASWLRQSVKVASQVTLNLASPGASIDGITMAANDRVLVKAQGSQAENGIYLWNGAASAMTRATDADTAAELAGAITQVLSGTDIGRTFRQSSLAVGATLGSAAVNWIAIDAAPRYKIEVWMLIDSVTTANQIAAMLNTTRPMSLLYPGFTAHLRDTPTIPYPFRNVRVGFTTGQRTSVTDQTFTITAPPPTWIE